MLNQSIFKKYHEKADKIFFFSLMNLMDNYLYKNYNLKYLIPTDVEVITNSFHQSCELYLKFKIKEKKPNLDVDNINSSDLPTKLLEIDSSSLNKSFKKYFHNNRKIRNKNIHDINNNLEDKSLKKSLEEFINTFVLFNNKDSFKKKLYKHILIKYKNYNKFNNRYDKKKYFYTYIFLLFNNKKNSAMQSNIESLLVINNNYKNSNHHFCPKCSERSLTYSFKNHLHPKLSSYKDFISNEIKTLYKLDNKQYKCFCCGIKIIKGKLAIEECIVCKSINSQKKESLTYDSKCLDCTLDKNKKLIISKLKNSYNIDNESAPKDHYYDALTLDEKYLMDCFNLMENVPNPNYQEHYSSMMVPIYIPIINYCTEFCLYRKMKIDNSLIEDKILTEEEKEKLYIEHKNLFNIADTISFSYKIYENCLINIFLYYKTNLTDNQKFYVLNYMNNLCWSAILFSIHSYYNINIETDYEELDLKYFEKKLYDRTKFLLK